jgi:uncharacterized protein YjbJ (UPF0337 family)
MAFDTQKLQGQWNQLRGKVKEKWGQLTDDDLQIHGGNFDQLVGRLQKKTGEGREAIEAFLTELSSQGSAAVAQAAESARDYAQQAGRQIREEYDRAAESARDGYRRAEDLVRHQPGASLATAFGVGLAVGVLVGLALRRP